MWELRLKWTSLTISGARKGPIEPGMMIAFAEMVGWADLPFTARHAGTTLDRPLGHKDPFDEALLAQAQSEGLRLLTRDTLLVGHPLAVS